MTRTALVGRTSELSVLAGMMEAVAVGTGRVVIVEGEAGIGKSALIEAAAARARESGLTVLAARAEAMDGHRPFGVLLDLLATPEATGVSRRGRVRALLFGGDAGEPPPGDATGFQLRVGEALLGLLEDHCSSGPTVVVIEDVHWADPSSLVVLHRLIRGLGQLPLALVCSVRPVPRSAELEQFLAGVSAGQQTSRVRLGPLTEEGCAALVESLVGAPPGRELRHQVADAGGNPLFVTELVATLDKEGAIELAPDGTARLAAATRLPSLRVTILHHLSFLDPATREALALASVLGVRFSVHELSLLSDRPVAALAPALRAALEAGVLGEEGERLAFRHELIRDALYEDTPLALRTALHRDAARALAACGEPAARVATHFLQAARPGDVEALEWLHRAATEAAPVAPQVAVDLWERVLDLADPSLQVNVEAQVGLALTLVDAGRPAEAEALCRRLLERGAPPGSEDELRYVLGQALFLQGRIGEAEQAAASDQLLAAQRARLLALGATMKLFTGDVEGALLASARAEAAAADTGDVPALVQALSIHGHVLCCRGQLSDAERLLSRAVALAEDDGSRQAHESTPHMHLGLVLVDLDRLAEAEEAVATGRRAAESFGSLTSVWMAHVIAVQAPFLSARFDDALAKLDAVAALSEETGIAWNGVALALRALISLYRDGPDEAERWVRLAEAAAATDGPMYGMAWTPRMQASYLLSRGQTEQALAVARDGWEACEAAGMVLEQWILGPLLAGLAACAGDGRQAEAAAAGVGALAAANPGVASLAGAAMHARGLAHRDADALLAGLGVSRASPRRYERARIAEDAAVALAGIGRRREAEVAGSEALELYAELGVGWEASRARAALRGVGLRPGVRGARGRPTTGWDALTPTEERVAGLVAKGLSNTEVARRLVLSRRTVESHVSHILGKLGFRSRSELVAAAAQRQAIEGLGQDRQQV